MPLPMMVPTTMAVAWLAPSTRGRSGGWLAVWVTRGETVWLMPCCEGSMGTRAFYDSSNVTPITGNRVDPGLDFGTIKKRKRSVAYERAMQRRNAAGHVLEFLPEVRGCREP